MKASLVVTVSLKSLSVVVIDTVDQDAGSLAPPETNTCPNVPGLLAPRFISLSILNSLNVTVPVIVGDVNVGDVNVLLVNV